MTDEIARGVIRRLTLKHPNVSILSTQVNGDTCCITFEFIDTNLQNVANWITRAGVMGEGDNRVCYAVFR